MARIGISPLLCAIASVAIGYAAPPAHERSVAVQTAIVRAAKASLGSAKGVKPGPNGAVFMAACTKPLAVKFVPPLTSTVEHATATVSCPAPAWRLYVNVGIAEEKNVLVVVTSVGMGDVIRANMVKAEEVPEEDISGGWIPPSRILGLKTAVPMSPGTVIGRGDVKIPNLVQSGQSIQGVLSEGGIKVTMRLVAMQDGSYGQKILVRNPDTNKTFEAKLNGNGTVAIPAP